VRIHWTARWALVAVAFVVTVASCRSLGDDGNGGDVPPDGATTGDIVPGDTGPDAVLLQVRSAGGFVPWGWDFSAMPTLTVYADGRAIVPGPQPAIDPGPVLPNLLVERLSKAGLDTLVQAADDAGLLAEPPDYGTPGITDVQTTYVTLTVGGQTYEHAAYALGYFEGESFERGDGTGAGDTGLTEDEAAARRVLAEFISAAEELVGDTGDGEPYEIEAFGVRAQPVLPDIAGAPDRSAEIVPWPLDAPLADMAECSVIDGDAARTLLGTLADVTDMTQFEQDGVTYSVWFRPLLPHESGCAGLG
jgi:hypothetical protein